VTTHRQRLRAQYVARVLDLEPRSLLDVGAGKGEVVAACRGAGVRALGVEPSDTVLEPVLEVEAGVLVRARAEALPLASGAVEWVAFRHVPHHLPDPAAAFAEAWRVAKRGLILADPGYDDDDPAQAAGRAADRWLKRMDRLRGMFHADVLSAREMLGLLPRTPERCETEFLGEPAPWKREALVEDRAEACLGIQVPPGEEAEWNRLLAAADGGQVSRNGTQLVVVWKGGGNPQPN
jgi:SAM-dependent methyltransferase